jgi:hypothetical protein
MNRDELPVSDSPWRDGFPVQIPVAREGGEISLVPEEDAERVREERNAHMKDAIRLAAENIRYRAALVEIRDWDGDEQYLDDVEVELKTIARTALEPS